MGGIILSGCGQHQEFNGLRPGKCRPELKWVPGPGRRCGNFFHHWRQTAWPKQPQRGLKHPLPASGKQRCLCIGGGVWNFTKAPGASQHKACQQPCGHAQRCQFIKQMRQNTPPISNKPSIKTRYRFNFSKHYHNNHWPVNMTTLYSRGTAAPREGEG